MDTLIYILVTLAILVAVAYWFRGYWPGIRTHYARARGFWQLFQGLREGADVNSPDMLMSTA